VKTHTKTAGKATMHVTKGQGQEGDKEQKRQDKLEHRAEKE